MPTSCSISMVRASATLREAVSCSSRASSIWRPMVMTGLSEVIGSWKIMEISLPRISRMAAASRPTRSTPSSRTEPSTMRPGGSATSRISDSAVTLLPQPELADDGQQSRRAGARRRRRRRPSPGRRGCRSRSEVLDLEHALAGGCFACGHVSGRAGERLPSRSAAWDRACRGWRRPAGWCRTPRR